LGKTQ